MRNAFLFLLFLSNACIAQNNDSINIADFVRIDSNGIAQLSIEKKGKNNYSLTEQIDQYNTFVLRHRAGVYKWQLLSSKIIFFISVVIVLVGLYLSYLQFKFVAFNSSKTNNKSKLDPEAVTENINDSVASSNTSLQISKEGIKIDSAIIGLIILIVSIVFFFLYLKYVFQINDIS